MNQDSYDDCNVVQNINKKVTNSNPPCLSYSIDAV